MRPRHRCIIPSCANNDLMILCHPFPKNRALAEKWKESLNLHEYTVEALIAKHAVCALHFDREEYRNTLSDSLTTTAIPRLHGIFPRMNNEVKRRTPEHWEDLADHLSRSLDSPEKQPTSGNGNEPIDPNEFDDSTIPRGSFIAPLPYSPPRRCMTESVMHEIDGFTLVDAESVRHIPSVPVNFGNIDGKGKFNGNGSSSSSSVHGKGNNKKLDAPVVNHFKADSTDSTSSLSDFRQDSSDSDVEVIRSQCSETENSCMSTSTMPSLRTNTDSACASVTSSSSASPKLSKKAELKVIPLNPESMNRCQLMEMIQSQTMKIRELEKIIIRYKTAHRTIIEQFDAFRHIVYGKNP